MEENLSMWKYTLMIVLFALSTALYAVFLWIFTQFPLWLIPGVTSLRPGNAFPPVTSLLWGPAASWGTAFGNLIGYDIMGGALTIGSVGGFIGNFVYGLLPYYTYGKVFKEEPHCKSISSLAKFEVTTFLTSSACGMIISLWTEAINFVPFGMLSLIITFNNFIAGAIIGPVLMALFYDRVKKMGWRWTDIMTGYSYTATEVSTKTMIGYGLVWLGFVIGNFITIGYALGFGQLNPFTGVGKFMFGGIGIANPIVDTGLVFIIIGLVGLAFIPTRRKA